MEDTEQKIRKYVLGERIYSDKIKISIDLVNSVLTAVIPNCLEKKTLVQGMAYNFKTINITICD